MITAFKISASESLLDGASFGTSGSYIRVTGTARGEVDPAAACNNIITDIDKAPRNARGNVEFATSFYLLRPADPAKGNGRLLYGVVNRGNKQLFQRLADAPSDANEFQTIDDIGNAFPLVRGYTIAWSGWDATAPTSAGRLALTAPIACNGNEAIVETIRDEFAIGMRPRGDEVLKLSYECAASASSAARLTVRHGSDGQRRELPADQWRFVDTRTVELLPRGTLPQVGATYEIWYAAKNPPVLGLGLAATRDFASYLRYHTGALALTGGKLGHALAIGFSQGGRYLRDHISLGFNRDESGRRVFDGALAHTAGVGRVFLNHRFGQPFRTCVRMEDHDFPENEFPFSTTTLHDPITGRRSSLFRGDDSDPCFIQTNTSTEYWQKGASLLHTDPLGKHDVDLPPNARVYMIAGTQHGGHAGVVAKPGKKTLHANNPHNPMPVLRALLVALDDWVVNGRTPPPSAVPRIADGTLVTPAEMGFPQLPDTSTARHSNQFGPPGNWVHPVRPERCYQPLVCRVDADGNEIAGVRTPDIVVPLATYTGWNIYRVPYPEGELADRTGSHVPFAVDKLQRERQRDPRPSIAERYPEHADYVAKVNFAAKSLANERLLLREDAERYIELATSSKLIKQ